MSRLSKKAITLESGVVCRHDDNAVILQGPKGELRVGLLPLIHVDTQENTIRVKSSDNSREARMNSGTMWSLINNAAHGVREGFSRALFITGVGYRASMEGNVLVLHLGFAHPIRFTLPEGIHIVVEKNIIRVSGIDKQLVGQAAAKIRSFKKPEPYKGKGIAYEGEVIRRKAGKKATSGTA